MVNHLDFHLLLAQPAISIEGALDTSCQGTLYRVKLILILFVSVWLSSHEVA